MQIQIKDSETVYRGRAFNVRKDLALFPSGLTKQIDIVEHSPAVVLVPVDETDNIWFITQYRHAVQKTIFELPAGVMEPGETPAACAAREIREEIGMCAAELIPLGGFYLAPGYSTEFLNIFLATHLSPSPLPGDDDEYIQVERITIAEAYTRASGGQIQDAKTLAALALARTHLLP